MMAFCAAHYFRLREINSGIKEGRTREETPKALAGVGSSLSDQEEDWEIGASEAKPPAKTKPARVKRSPIITITPESPYFVKTFESHNQVISSFAQLEELASQGLFVQFSLSEEMVFPSPSSVAGSISYPAGGGGGGGGAL